MIFFFSKFVPMLFYPVGACCLLIVIAIVAQISDRRRIAIASNFAALAILGLMGNSFISSLLTRSLEMVHVPAGPLPQADAIVVLGGVAAPAYPPQPTIHLGAADRLIYAAQLYHEHKAPLVVIDGGKSPWDENLPPESKLMAEILEVLGVPNSAILEESLSRNTHEGGVNLKQLLLDHKIHTSLLVTSAIHMPRALAVFRHEGIDANPAPTDFEDSGPPPKGTRGLLEETALQLPPDVDSLGQSTRALKEYLGLIAYRVAGWI